MLALALVCAVPNVATAQAGDSAHALAEHLVRLTAHRFGVEPACGVAFFAGSPGLLLTTYQAIRGAERLEVIANDGRDLTDWTRVASYSTTADLAVLHAEGAQVDSLPLSSDIAVGGLVSAWGFDNSAHVLELPVSITSREGPSPHGLYLTEIESNCSLGGPLVDRSGAVVGIVAKKDAATPSSTATALLSTARRNIANGRVESVADVAGRERHLYGSAMLDADVSGSLVRVQPLESWHWPELVEERHLPFTFGGPMGRYEVEILSQGNHSQSIFEITPGAAIRIKLFPGAVAGGGGKKLPWVLGVLGAAGAGTAVVLASGTGGEIAPPPPPPPPAPGGIVVTMPKYIPRS
jgi:hypothetical protein